MQLAPLATMLSDDQAATCKRCPLKTPDTLPHWLTECPALDNHRTTFHTALMKWAKELDNALNLAHGVMIQNRWASLPLPQKIQALQGEVPPQLTALFRTPPMTANTLTPTPQPLLKHDMLRKLVNIMEAYCKHTFEAIRLHNKPRHYTRRHSQNVIP
jgi:hypothetical protein